METEVFELPRDSFPKEVGKAFVISSASSAGLFAGMALVGAVLSWREKKRKKTETPEETTEEA